MAGRPAFDAVVLAGGTARRMGGLDKPMQQVGGHTLLDGVLAAAAGAGAARLVVVGPRRRVGAARPVWTRERPPGGGPLAALAAGLAEVTAPLVAVLAADLAFLRPDDLERLRSAAGVGAAVLVDGDGRDQWLAGVYPSAALRAVMPADPAGVGIGPVLGPLVTARVRPDRGGAGPPGWFDCDTPDDLALARRWA